MGEWIDDVARAMAGGTSRRAMLRRVGGGVAAAMLASLIPATASAREGKGGKGNTKQQDTNQNTQQNTTTNLQCPTGQVEFRGKCRNFRGTCTVGLVCGNVQACGQDPDGTRCFCVDVGTGNANGSTAIACVREITQCDPRQSGGNKVCTTNDDCARFEVCQTVSCCGEVRDANGGLVAAAGSGRCVQPCGLRRNRRR